MSEEAPVYKRRVRYKGRNPRQFEERYKEHNPEKYAAEAEHIIAKGNTLAGSHRPICVDEILAILKPQPGEIGLDVTLGYGGHSQQILPRLLPGGKLFGLDADPIELPKTEARLRALGFGEDVFQAREMNFSEIQSLSSEVSGGFDFILADLGVSSMQLDNPARGFSHKADGPLDLRLNPNQGKSAEELVRKASAAKLEAILSDFADEPHAEAIALAIKSHRGPLTRTTQLSQLVRERLKRIRPTQSEDDIKKSIQRTFMALRIAVNQEFRMLELFLEAIAFCMKPGARVVILTFHSGEDRRVKEAFGTGLHYNHYSSIAPTPLRPSPEECRSNPRSSCAKLRWAIRSDMSLD